MSITKSFIRSESPSPIKSGKILPNNHFIQERYKSYNRAEDYIKHLNNIYNSHVVTSGKYDEAYYNSYKFRLQEPKENSKFKVSQCPKAKVNQELLEKQEIINAFNHITYESRPHTRPRPKSTIPSRHKRSSTEKASFTYKQAKLIDNEKCENCHKIVCLCPKVIKDNFLNAMMKKQRKIMEKLSRNSFGGYRNSEFIVNLKDNSIVFPGRSNTYENFTGRRISLKKKSTKVLKKNQKKELFSPFSPFESSISISPVNLMYRKQKSIKVQ